MKRVSLLVGLFAAALVSGLAQGPAAPAEPQVPYALKKAIQQAPKLRYSGRRKVQYLRNGETDSYVELVSRDGDQLRIEFPSGSTYSGQIIVETGNERRHFFPDRNEIQILPPRREEAFERIVKLAQNRGRFTLSEGAGETVAGIATDQIVVTDRSGNVVQRLYIDPKSGMLLKRKIYDPVGTQVGFFEFESVNFSPTFTKSIFHLSRNGAKLLKPVDLLRKLAQDNGYPVIYLKPSTGFTLSFSKMNTVDGREVLMQFYQSPNGRLSLFETKADIDREKLDKFARGDVNVYSWKGQGCTFVLIGNQDADALRKLASHMAYGT